MLEQLIESKNNSKQAARRLGILSTTFTFIVALSFSGVLWSLFAMNIGVGEGEFDLSALLAPVNVVEDKPEPVKKNEERPTETSDKTTRQANMLRTDEPTLIPTGISVTQNKTKARPVGKFEIDPRGAERDASSLDYSSNLSDGDGIGEKQKTDVADEKDLPELTKPTVKITKPVRVSTLLNGKATYLPKPAYPQPAVLVGASGAVNVEVTIDEEGRVISARAVTGHGLLKGAAEGAARNARFSPTILNDQKVRVTGIIVYNFVKK